MQSCRGGRRPRGSRSNGASPRTFGGSNGADPLAGLIADARGNLFGTTDVGGASSNCPSGCGTVFEITNSGFVPPGPFVGTPGQANCHGQSVSALAQQYGGMAAAAAALGYSSVGVLQSDIHVYCAG